MDSIKDIVLKEANSLNSKIEKKQKKLTLLSIMRVRNYGNLLTRAKGMQSIISQCIQCGNYRRAYMFIIITNKFIDDLSLSEMDAINKLTEIILNGDIR